MTSRRSLIAFCCAIAVLGVELAAPAGAASSWTLRQLPAKQLEGGYADQVPPNGVSCPSKALCVAVGGLDTVAVSQSPTAAAGIAGASAIRPTPSQSRAASKKKG